MANLGVPPQVEYKDIPADAYEVITGEVEEVPNSFYDPDKDSPTKATQFKWKLVIREEGELQGIPLTMYTGSSIGRNSRNKLTNFVKLVDKTFDIEVGYKDEEDFRLRVLHQPLRVTTQVIEKTQDDGEVKKYAKVTGTLPSKMGKVSQEELIKLILGAEPA
jgi:hypothetical protein